MPRTPEACHGQTHQDEHRQARCESPRARPATVQRIPPGAPVAGTSRAARHGRGTRTRHAGARCADRSPRGGCWPDVPEPGTARAGLAGRPGQPDQRGHGGQRPVARAHGSGDQGASLHDQPGRCTAHQRRAICHAARPDPGHDVARCRRACSCPRGTCGSTVCPAQHGRGAAKAHHRWPNNSRVWSGTRSCTTERLQAAASQPCYRRIR